ncbi:hypothetical protein PHYSODRAFT_342980 [Phytophthora sojae]|uniref:ABC transporter domain-containing protein n=1 Tax=Phytophthora sojae (strain P6497) TaxID=1094619 RepID=G5AI66_PHYSP|nr:hypothetical protein PHYSODRAFT_342980 [Phytophthora sojae]EGZ04791.1 hypothetical protein PHYSODRAFT_342980 [Phytophthora sojae]|eukprot:XP_009539767.1 hypothetical protein PHYSODRAFT_342980 [Phytophthora sojae]
MFKPVVFALAFASVAHAACPDGEEEISVQGIDSYFCVNGEGCAGSNSLGLCPDEQDGLEFGSYCDLLETGVYGCKPYSDWDTASSTEYDAPLNCTGNIAGEFSVSDGLPDGSVCVIIQTGVYGCVLPPTSPKDAPPPPAVAVSVAAPTSLTDCAPSALHEYVASCLERALGRALPHMEIRFKRLSVTADVPVVEQTSGLPTLWNAVRLAVAGVGRKPRVVRKEILKDVSGSFRPGSMTLVLGQPGSGKSALMKVLSGRFPLAKNVALTGEITYNGETQERVRDQLPQFVAYVTQRDNHFAVLTVRETLEFAHKFCGGELIRRGEELLTNGTEEENARALEAARELFDKYPDIVVQQLGLQDCQDTIVGDALMRGISGGEKKRVTTGEMEFGMKYVTLMDEISTGLDSAATFDIINTQCSVARKFNKTVVALFDEILILNAGEVMYHGPMQEVVPYFSALGFECPTGRDVADFLMDLGTKQQGQYQVELSTRNYVHPREPSEFARVFRESQIYQDTLRKLEEPLQPTLLEHVDQHMNPMPQFHQSFWENTRTLLHRQVLITVRNKPYIFGRGLMITVMGLLYATSFYQFDPTEIQVVIGIIFAASLFLSLGQASQLPTFIAARDIFYKQRGANFFRTSSYVLANSVSQLPLCVAETLIFGTLVYWMFVSHASEFFLFLLVLFLTNVSLGSFYFSLTAASKDINIATPISMAATLIIIIWAYSAPVRRGGAAGRMVPCRAHGYWNQKCTTPSFSSYSSALSSSSTFSSSSFSSRCAAFFSQYLAFPLWGFFEALLTVLEEPSPVPGLRGVPALPALAGSAWTLLLLSDPVRGVEVQLGPASDAAPVTL